MYKGPLIPHSNFIPKVNFSKPSVLQLINLPKGLKHYLSIGNMAEITTSFCE